MEPQDAHEEDPAASSDHPQWLGRRLDLHHRPEVVGVVSICTVCSVSTDDAHARGVRHYPEPDETERARVYLLVFGEAGAPRERGGDGQRLRSLRMFGESPREG